MNNFRNFVFIDSDSFEKCPVELLSNELSSYNVEFIRASEWDVSREFAEIVKMKIAGSVLKNYVVLTSRPVAFHEQFISNNIIETTEPKKVKSIVNEIKYVFDNFGLDRIKPAQRIFLTSDQHFYHRNIIKYCNRPWNSGTGPDGQMVITDEDVERMNETMIEKWNSVVGEDDIVYNLGDVIFGDKTRLSGIMSRLNGRKRLILGNHDHAARKEDVVKFYMDAGFERVYDRNIIIQDFIILSHFPLQFLNSNCPFYSCFGHVHNSEIFPTWTRNSCCVCVERHDYTPVSLDLIKQKYEEMNK